MTSSWFFLSTLNYDPRSTTHQIYIISYFMKFRTTLSAGAHKCFQKSRGHIIILGAWIFVCCECFVLSGTGLCDELITRPEESYRLRCVVVCDLETSWMRRPWPHWGLSRQKQTNKHYIIILGDRKVTQQVSSTNIRDHLKKNQSRKTDGAMDLCTPEVMSRPDLTLKSVSDLVAYT